MNWGEDTIQSRHLIKKRQPLIHNLTNFVVMNSTANVILAVGASPVMAHALEEVEEMASHADAVVLNIGTLEPAWVDAMILAGKSANKKGIPVVFDPVGVGATQYRSRSAERILSQITCNIIRANASEILALAGMPVRIRGVDSLQDVDEFAMKAKDIARKLGTVIAVTGVEDIISDGERTIGVSGGDPMFKRVTGTGCAASATVACFAAVQPNYLTAAAQALGFYGIAGMEAAYRAKGPGSFQVELFDALANLSDQTIKNSISVREL